MKNKIFLELSFKDLNINLIKIINNKLIFVLKEMLNFQNSESSFTIINNYTPERLVIQLEFNDNISLFYKGVKINDTKEHLDFFLKKQNLKNLDNLKIINNTYYYKKDLSDVDITKNIVNGINLFFKKTFIDLKIEKNPLLNLTNIIFFVNEKNIKIKFNNIDSSNIVKINNDNFIINSIDEYYLLMSKNNIFFEIYNRSEYINKKLLIIDCDKNNKKNFVDNVLSIKENPLFIINKLNFTCDDLYLQILQKFLKDKFLFFKNNSNLYYIFIDNNGKNFINLNNIDDNQQNKKIEKAILKINGFLKNFEKEKKNKEQKSIFNENKINRLKILSKFVSIWIPFCKMENINDILSNFIFKTSNLLNNDNLELTLLLKKYIFLQTNKNKEIIETIIDSFRPFEKEKKLPNLPISNTISLSNKIDNIVYFSILKMLNIRFNKEDEKENYNNLIKIIIKNKINLPLKIVFNYSIKNFLNESIKIRQNIKFFKKFKINKNDILNNILENIYNKMYFYMSNGKNENILAILINIERNSINNNINKKCNLLKDYNKIIDFYEFLSNNDLEILQVYKRLSKLLIKYDNKYKNKFNILKIKPIILDLKRNFKLKEEDNLYKAYFAIRKEIKFNLIAKNYYQIMISLNKITKILNDFLNVVFIEKSNIFKKVKRLKLLFCIKNLFDKITNFEELTKKI